MKYKLLFLIIMQTAFSKQKNNKKIKRRLTEALGIGAITSGSMLLLKKASYVDPKLYSLFNNMSNKEVGIRSFLVAFGLYSLELLDEGVSAEKNTNSLNEKIQYEKERSKTINTELMQIPKPWTL